MRAFVMSGGGNRGALQAGALLELLEAGLTPDILVGTSAGALNAGVLATDPTLAGAQRLAEIWTGARKDDLFPGNTITMLARLAQGHSLFSSDALRRFVEQTLPADRRRFGDLRGVRLYITASNLNTGQIYLYGNHPDASLADAMVASAAHPLAFPPVSYADMQLVDGGVVLNVPISVAIEHGATEIYVLNVGYGGQLVPDQENIIQVLGRAIDVMMYQPLLLDLKHAAANPQITLHHIQMAAFQGMQMWDLSQSAAMVRFGQQTVRRYLEQPDGQGGVSFGGPGQDNPEPPTGAELYAPPWLRNL